MPLTFKEWIEQQGAILRDRFPNYDRWDTTGSPTVVIRVTKNQDKRAIFKDLTQRGKYTVVAFEDDREVYRDEYRFPLPATGDAAPEAHPGATGGRDT